MDSEEVSYYNILNKKMVSDKLSELLSNESSTPENFIKVFLDILDDLKEEEAGHINKSLAANDLRAAALCHEALGAYQTLSNMLTTE